jgi:hypothetical protein
MTEPQRKALSAFRLTNETFILRESANVVALLTIYPSRPERLRRVDLNSMGESCNVRDCYVKSSLKSTGGNRRSR